MSLSKADMIPREAAPAAVGRKELTDALAAAYCTL